MGLNPFQNCDAEENWGPLLQAIGRMRGFRPWPNAPNAFDSANRPSCTQLCAGRGLRTQLLLPGPDLADRVLDRGHVGIKDMYHPTPSQWYWPGHALSGSDLHCVYGPMQCPPMVLCNVLLRERAMAAPYWPRPALRHPRSNKPTRLPEIKYKQPRAQIAWSPIRNSSGFQLPESKACFHRRIACPARVRLDAVKAAWPQRGA
eukprot:2553811-Rhodomonas_salina.1